MKKTKLAAKNFAEMIAELNKQKRKLKKENILLQGK